MTGTFLEKIENLFEELKADLEARIGTHVAILDGVANAKMGVLTAAAEHFGEDSEEVGKPALVPDASTSSSDGQSAPSGDLTAAIEEAEKAVQEANDKGENA